MGNRTRKVLLVFLVSLVAIGVVFGWNQFQKRALQKQKPLPTYFSYSEEDLNSLRRLKAHNSIEIEDVRRWDDIAFEAVSAAKADATAASKFYAYLTVAQRDAAYLSRNVQGQLKGSLDPVSKQITCLFFPESCPKILPLEETCSYSEALSKVVLAKVKQRIEEDRRSTRPYELKLGDQFWAGKAPFRGIDTGSWKPWLIPSARQFRLPPPPDFNTPEGFKQLEDVKNLFTTLTDKQKAAIAYWAGGPGTKTPPGIWLQIASDAISKTSLSLERILFIRSVLAMGLADTEIAAMDSKYTYWAKRPFMLDHSIVTFMPTPNHPSYPSDSSAVAALSSAILSHYLPEEKGRWNKLAEVATYSRFSSGIHFPVDVEQAVALGRNVAQAVIHKAEADFHSQ